MGYSLDPQAFLLSPLDMDGIEFAALDTVSVHAGGGVSEQSAVYVCGVVEVAIGPDG